MARGGEELHREHPIFAGVEPEVVRGLQNAGTLRALPGGALVFEEGAEDVAMFVLCRGAVQASCASSEGAEVMTALWHAPSVFGEAACMLGGAHRETVRVLERAVMLELPRAAVLDAIQRSHAFSLNLLRAISGKLSAAIEQERELAFHPVEKRLADLLNRYAQLFGLPVPAGTKIRVPLTQEGLAQALGVARRSITRAMQSWIDRGILMKEGKYFVLKDPLALHA